MKYPEQMSANDFTRYTFGAVLRETGEKWQPKPYIVATWGRQFKSLLASEVPSYLIALGLDILALDWEYSVSLSPWEALSTGYLLKPFRDGGGGVWFWRAVWFSRFAKTESEVNFYNHWLTASRQGTETPTGTAGKGEYIKDVREKLQRAEVKIKRQRRQPVFKLHWLENWSKTWQ